MIWLLEEFVDDYVFARTSSCYSLLVELEARCLDDPPPALVVVALGLADAGDGAWSVPGVRSGRMRGNAEGTSLRARP